MKKKMIRPKSLQEISLFGKKICLLHPDAKDSLNANNERWFIYAHQNHDGGFTEEEIYWKGHSVIVSVYDAHLNDYTLKRCFTVGSNVKHTLYTNFYLKENNTGFEKCLVVMEKECLNIFTSSGQLFVASLPFKVKRIWPLQNGVCVERDVTSDSDADKRGMPTLFSLTHPLEDFKPIVYRYQDSKNPMYFTDATQSIVYTNTEKCLIMTYDYVLGLHSIWTARKAVEKDFPNSPNHQDSLPEFLALSHNHSYLGLDIKSHSRVSLSPAPNKRHSCPPIPFANQGKRYSPGRNVSPMTKLFTPGAQSHVNRHSPYQYAVHDSSHVSNEHSAQKRSKLSSPMILRMSYDESILEEDLEPLPPDICLEQVWQEQGNILRHGTKGRADYGLMTSDFCGNTYVGYFIKALSKFKLLLSSESKGSLHFEKVFEIECLTVGAFKNLDVFIVLDMSQNLQIYSGKQKVGTLVIPNVNTDTMKGCVMQQLSLTHFSATSFLLSVAEDSLKRIELYTLTHSNFMKSSIAILKDFLTHDEYNLACAKYYAIFYNHNNVMDKGIASWDKFVLGSFKLLGFPDSSMKSFKVQNGSPAPPQPKKAKKSDSLVGAEDWEYLLATNLDYPIAQQIKEETKEKYSVEVRLRVNAPLYKNIPQIFIAWHQLYEEIKLNVLESAHLQNFAKLLHYLSKVLCAPHHMTIYETDFPHLRLNQDTKYHLIDEGHETVKVHLKNFALTQCSFYEYVKKMFEDMKVSHAFSKKHKTKALSVVSKLFSAIMRHLNRGKNDEETLISDLKLDEETLMTGLNNDSLVEEIIHIMMAEKFSHSDIERLPIGYKLPIKEILHHYKGTDHAEMDMKAAMFLGRDDIVATKNHQFQAQNGHVSLEANEDKDGMFFNPEILKFRFNEDLRIDEVKKMLNASIPVNISLIQNPDVNDHAFAKEEEAKLLLLNNRTMSLPVARGMFTMGTSQPVASEAVPIPTLDLTGRSTTNNKTVQAPQSDALSSRQMWPLFHNGVAAGLKIAPGSEQVEFTWILFNKLKFGDLNPSHSGFLYALGLTGHLSVLPKINLLDYLIKGHEMTTIALLLGISATQIGTRNAETYKLLSLHLESLLPPTALELNIPQSSQVATIFSLGLLFFKSADSHLTKVLLYEIGKPPGPEMENNADRESHALAAGFALGMIMIGQGKDSLTVAGINVPDLLYHYMFGGQKRQDIMNIHDAEQAPSSQIQEGNVVNTYVTSPAAVIALALMFLKTNNSDVANWLKVDQSENVMDLLKPDDLLLRSLAYHLIMWDDLVPNAQSCGTFLPELSFVSTDEDLLNHNSKLDVHYLICAISGSFLSLGLKYAGSANLAAFQLMFPWISKIRKLIGSPLADILQAKTVLEQCLNTVLIAVSLAGIKTRYLLQKRHRTFLLQFITATSVRKDEELMAGTGNIQIMRVIRQLRKGCVLDVWYGHHMATHMALGFLFLGGGRYTLKTDDLSIACLLCSVYPKWPITSKDNRFHLQAFRHLYVLASEPRLFVTRDVDTKKICYTPIQVTLKETKSYPETTLKFLSPCFVPQIKDIVQIKVVGERYWPVTLKVNGRSTNTAEILNNVFVKKKAGYLSYSEDPRGNRNLLARTFTNQSDKLDLIKSFNSSPSVLLFEELFCAPLKKNGVMNRQTYYANVLYECVTKDKLDVLEDYLCIERIVQNCERNNFLLNDLQQINLLFLYSTIIRPKLKYLDIIDKGPLIDDLYFTQCKLRMEQACLHQRADSMPWVLNNAREIMKTWW